MIKEYKAEIITRLTSPPDVVTRLSINGGLGNIEKFNPEIDILWGEVTQPIAKDQFLDINYKKLQRDNKSKVEQIEECFVQYRDFRYEKNGIGVHCDNYHGDPNAFHLKETKNLSEKGKEKLIWEKKPKFDLQTNPNLNRFRFALHSVLQYVEQNYDPLIAPKFFFPMSYYFGLRIPDSLKKLKPEGISLSSYSEMIAMMTLPQNKKYENLENWISESVLPATAAIDRAIEEGKDIVLLFQGELTMFPIPIFATLKSNVQMKNYNPRSRTLNIEPFCFVFEKNKAKS